MLDVIEMWRTLWTVCWKMLGLKELLVKMVGTAHSAALLSGCVLAVCTCSLSTVNYSLIDDAFFDLD